MMLSRFIILVICWSLPFALFAQPPHGTAWSKDGNGYYELNNKEIVYNNLATSKTTVVASKEQLTPNGASQPIGVRNYFFSDDGNKLLIYTNTKRVWRYDTKGDYWLMDLINHTLKQLGAGRPESSLMFAKFSPDGKKVAYVSEYNIYVEDIASGKIDQLIQGGNRELIN